MTKKQEQKITEIVDNLWLCCYPQEVECCAVGKNISAETRAKLKADILALIEHEQTPMVEALQTAKTEIAFMLKYIEELQENIRKLKANRMPIVSKSLRQIDAVLEGK